MVKKLIGVFDKVSATFVLYHFVDTDTNAIRGFILQMAQPCDLSAFHDDFDLYELGLIDDVGVTTMYESRKLLITGIQAFKAAQNYKLTSEELPEEVKE